MQMTT
jgi:hypothetical protein